MKHILKKKITTQWLAENLGLSIVGIDRSISCISAINDADEDCLSFYRGAPESLSLNIKQCSIFCNHAENIEGITLIVSKNPRLDFIKALNFITEFIGFEKNIPTEIHPSVTIGMNVVIEPGVQIAANTIIGHNVVIRSGTIIGENCLFQPGAIIGEEGFGFEQDIDGVYVKMPHLGGLIIGNNVQVGANTTICRGALTNTIIGNGVKIDNLVHVGHNCQIGNNVIVTACSELGGIKIEDDVWIGPNSCIREKLTIGQRALIGIGSVVVKDVLKNTVVAGNPAKVLRDRD